MPNANEQEDLRHLRAAGDLLGGPDPLARLPLRRRRARGAQKVPSDLKEGQALFQTNCGTCHTLYAAGTDGNFAPNLDELLAPSGPPTGEGAGATIKATKERVLNAVKTASTARRPRAGCRPGSSTANRPKRSPNSSPHRRRGLKKRRVLRESRGTNWDRSLDPSISRPGAALWPWGPGLRPFDGP